LILYTLEPIVAPATPAEHAANPTAQPNS
jgi:hypothetical protein